MAAALHVRYVTVSAGAERFRATGLGMLQDQARSGRPLQITGPERARLTALACSEARAGHSQWSLRLLAGKAVELGYCRRLSTRSAHAILKKTTCAPS